MVTIPTKIPIYIHPLFFVLMVAIGWLNSFTLLGTVLWSIVIFFSVLIHEYGHALTAAFFGQTTQIHLVALGGLTKREGSKLKLWQEFLIVINGPLAGFMLFIGAYALIIWLKPTANTTLSYLLNVTMYANLFWTFINLLPVHPLDGGHLLRIILEGLFGVRGIKIALFISCLLAVAAGLFFFAMQSTLAGVLFLMLAFESYRAWKDSLTITHLDQNDDLQQMLREVEEDLSLGREGSATIKLQQIREATQRGLIYVTSTEYLSALLSRQGHVQEAYQILLPLQKELSSEALKLLHQLAYRNSDWKEVVTVGNQIYQLSPGYDVALMNSFGNAALGEVKAAIGWLQCAIRDGLPNPREVLRKPEFNNIRNSPQFNDLERKLV